MHKIRPTLVALAVIATIASFRNYGWAAEFAQKVAVGPVSATMRVAPAGRNNFQFLVEFRSSTYPVGCLSVYRDLHYELRTTDNRIVPINQQTLQHPPYEGPGIYEHVIKGSPGHGCAENAPQGVWPVFALFSALYPNLPPGQYTLYITLAPHDMTQHADFTPVPITIAPAPSSP